MAGRLSHAASRIMGGTGGAVSRSLLSSLRQRSGLAPPVGKHIVPDKPLPVKDDLFWDSGTPFLEPCINRLDHIGRYEALAWWCGGMTFFGSVALLAVWNDKVSKVTFTPKVFPYDNLKVELGEDPVGRLLLPRSKFVLFLLLLRSSLTANNNNKQSIANKWIQAQYYFLSGFVF